MAGTQEEVFISVGEGLDDTRKKNLHITVGLLNFTWMLFHFTVIFFFTFRLESLALVWAFLGLGNFFAFLLDVPLGVLQGYIKSKTFYILGAISQGVALLIFINFIYEFNGDIVESVVAGNGVLDTLLSLFLKDFLNIVLLLVASLCYGFTKEINEITTISYVLNKANPSQYREIISRNNLFTGIGAFLGLMTSGLILSFTPELIIFSMLFVIGSIIYVMFKLFDNASYTVTKKDLDKFKVYFQKDGLGKVKDSLVETISNIDIKARVGDAKYIFMRPVVKTEKKIQLSELIVQTKESFLSIRSTLKYALSNYLLVYWALIMVLTFGFWDTFASTFLIDFLDEVAKGYSYLLLWVIAFPAFWLQDVFGKLADKFGTYTMANIGLVISGVSLFLMAIFWWGHNFLIVMGLALLNSTGYAICMSLSVATFLESYNRAYADNLKLDEVDANVSAAPIKILQNLANVIGLTLGGLILGIFGYTGFFFLFGGMIIGIAIWSLKNKSKIIATSSVMKSEFDE